MCIFLLFKLFIIFFSQFSICHIAQPNLRHYSDGEHNSEFDHEHFLGHDLSQEMDDLPLDEVLNRLGKIFDKIDYNNDSKLDTEEMVKWMRNMTRSFINQDSERYWKELGIGEGQTLSWDAYTNSISENNDDESELMKSILKRDKRRFTDADVNKDGVLDREEVTAFIHPEEFEQTRASVALELLDEVDLDKDGYISEEEYLKDMGFTNDPSMQESRETERLYFHKKRDKDHDGKLNFDEFVDWLAPSPDKFAIDEAQHLIDEADDDKDGMISKEEMLRHHQVFAGSQVTNYGDVIRGRHDEL